MFDPEILFEKASYSRFHKWILNIALDRMVPFNKPHGFKVLEITKQRVTTHIPYKKSNLNHIKGLHATALATLSEFTTGLMLINILGTKNYRIILQRLDIEYHYQGKRDAVATFKVDDLWLNENVHKPLASQESTIVPCKVSISDIKKNKLTSATIYWQIKSWEKVKTKL